MSIGLSFLNPSIIIASSTVPILDGIMLISEKDKKVSHLKMQKDIINQIIKEIQMKKYTIEGDNEAKNIFWKFMEKLKQF